MSPMCLFNDRKDEETIQRFICVVKIWEDAVNTGHPVTIIGDINIDTLKGKDPKSRADLKNLIPILKKFQDDFNFAILNKKPTLFQQGQRPSLLDLLLTNKPESISDIQNVANWSSEHQGVYCMIKVNNLITTVGL